MGCVGSYDPIEMQGMVKKSVVGQKKAAPDLHKVKQKQAPPTIERRIKLCTVNVGKSISPFEYFISSYDDKTRVSSISPDQQQLNQVFERVSRLYRLSKPGEKKDNKNKNKVTITNQMHYRTLKRYTPLKNPKAGVKTQKKLLMTKEQFCEKWNQEFIERENWLGFTSIINWREKQQIKAGLRQFDLICYHTLVAYVYEVKGFLTDEDIDNYLPSGTDPVEHLNKMVFENLSMKYEAEMDSRFGNTIFNIRQKIDRLFYFIDKSQFDIIFLQEIPKRELEFIKSKLKSYRLVSSKTCSSALLVRLQLSFELEKRQKNLTLLGHNARYLESNLLSNIKKNQEKNKTVDTFKFSNDNTTLFNKIGLIFSESAKKNVPEQDRKMKPIKEQSELQEKQDEQINIELKSELNQKNSSLIYRDLIRHTSLVQRLANQTIKLYSQSQQKTENVQQQTIESIRRKTNSTYEGNNLNNNNSRLKKTFSNGFTSGILEVEEEQIFAPSQLVKATNSIIIAGAGKIKDHKIKDLSQKIQLVCQFIGCLILTSAKVTTREEAQNLKITLDNMSKRFPHHTIIVGLSSHISSKKVRKTTIRDHMKIFRNVEEEDLKFHFTPNIYNAIPGFFEDEKCSISNHKLKSLVEKKGLFTTLNKKTRFNVNEDEHKLQYLGTDNFIISNRKIFQEQIKACNCQTINEDSTFCKQKRSIPNRDHPFSDFFVCGEIYTNICQVLQENQQSDSDEENQFDEENQEKNRG